MLLEYGDNGLTHGSSWYLPWRGGLRCAFLAHDEETAGHIEQTLVLLLQMLSKLQQHRLPLAGCV
jgi:hypothetical protein